MRHLTKSIRSEKCVDRRLCRRANVYVYKSREYVVQYTANYTPRLLLLSYKPVQRVPALNSAGNCNSDILFLLYYIILYYIIYDIYYIILQSYGTTVVYAVRCWPKRRYAAHTYNIT